MYTDQQLYALRDYLHAHGCTPDTYQVVTPLPQRMQHQVALPGGFFAHQTTFLSMVSPGNKKKKFSAQNKRFKIEFIWDYPKCYATNPEILLSAHDRQTEFDFSAFYRPEWQFDTAFLAWLLPPDLLKSTLLPFDSDSLSR